MSGPRSRTAGALLVGAVVGALSATAGCGFAVKHPAITAGVVGGTLGLATCKLASDNLGACLAVGGGAGASLGLITAVALWLGGDGETAAVEEQAQPLPEDDRPHRRRPQRPAEPASPTPGSATPGSATPGSAMPGSATLRSPMLGALRLRER